MYHTVPHKKQALTSNIYHTKLVAALDPWEGFGGVQEARTLTVARDLACLSLALNPEIAHGNSLGMAQEFTSTNACLLSPEFESQT